MIKAGKRTWMRVTGDDGYSIWLGIEHDSIVAQYDRDGIMGMAVGLRADDTLSSFRRGGWKIEGPFDHAPE